MKLLKQFQSHTEAQLLSEHMRDHGILTYIANTNTKNLGAIGAGPLPVGVWVIVNEQVDDAVQLLHDPNHPVFSPLTEEQMQAFDKDANTAAQSQIYHFMMKWLTTTLVLGLVSWLIYTTLF